MRGQPCRPVGSPAGLKPVDRSAELRFRRAHRAQEMRSSRASHSGPGPEEGASSEHAGESEGEIGSDACNLRHKQVMEER